MHVAAQALMLLWCASDLAAQLQLGAPSPPPRPGRWLRAPTAAAAPPALTVLVAVPWHRFTTIADYLGELQHRHGDHLLLQVLLADAPPDGAELPAGTYAIGVDDQQRSALLLRGDADAAATWRRASPTWSRMRAPATSTPSRRHGRSACARRHSANSPAAAATARRHWPGWSSTRRATVWHGRCATCGCRNSAAIRWRRGRWCRRPARRWWPTARRSVCSPIWCCAAIHS